MKLFDLFKMQMDPEQLKAMEQFQELKDNWQPWYWLLLSIVLVIGGFICFVMYNVQKHKHEPEDAKEPDSTEDTSEKSKE